MTKRELSKHYGLPAFLLGVAGLGFWLLSTAFVTRREYDPREQVQDSVIRDMRGDVKQLKRIGCIQLSPEQARLVGCVLP